MLLRGYWPNSASLFGPTLMVPFFFPYSLFIGEGVEGVDQRKGVCMWGRRVEASHEHVDRTRGGEWREGERG